MANDSHVAALAEYAHGFPEGESLVLVRVGRGRRCGNRPRRPAIPWARLRGGEIGHVVVDADGSPCWCGRRGCLETVVAMHSLLAAASVVLGRQASPIDLASDSVAGIVTAAGQLAGSCARPCRRHARRTARRPRGPVRAAGEPFREAVAETIRDRVLPTMSAQVDVRWAALDADLVLAGASAMVLAAELGVVWR